MSKLQFSTHHTFHSFYFSPLREEGLRNSLVDSAEDAKKLFITQYRYIRSGISGIPQAIQALLPSEDTRRLTDVVPDHEP